MVRDGGQGRVLGLGLRSGFWDGGKEQILGFEVGLGFETWVRVRVGFSGRGQIGFPDRGRVGFGIGGRGRILGSSYGRVSRCGSKPTQTLIPKPDLDLRPET